MNYLARLWLGKASFESFGINVTRFLSIYSKYYGANSFTFQKISFLAFFFFFEAAWVLKEKAWSQSAVFFPIDYQKYEIYEYPTSRECKILVYLFFADFFVCYFEAISLLLFSSYRYYLMYCNVIYLHYINIRSSPDLKILCTFFILALHF